MAKMALLASVPVTAGHWPPRRLGRQAHRERRQAALGLFFAIANHSQL
jgi:hypothetical protein